MEYHRPDTSDWEVLGSFSGENKDKTTAALTLPVIQNLKVRLELLKKIFVLHVYIVKKHSYIKKKMLCLRIILKQSTSSLNTMIWKHTSFMLFGSSLKISIVLIARKQRVAIDNIVLRPGKCDQREKGKTSGYNIF